MYLKRGFSTLSLQAIHSIGLCTMVQSSLGMGQCHADRLESMQTSERTERSNERLSKASHPERVSGASQWMSGQANGPLLNTSIPSHFSPQCSGAPRLSFLSLTHDVKSNKTHIESGDKTSQFSRVLERARVSPNPHPPPPPPPLLFSNLASSYLCVTSRTP